MKRMGGCLVAALLACQFASAADVTSAGADAAKRAGLDFFESKIRPVLVERCYSCHSAKAATEKKLRGGLLLDSRDGTRKGGDTGPAVVPGDVAKSLLIETLQYESSIQMPPDGKLPEAILADFIHWIEIGAPDPRDGTANPAPNNTQAEEIDIEAGRQLWSFQPLEPTAPPEVKHAAWVRTPIDHFVRKRQEDAGIAPNGIADLQTLIRRVHYDIIGLPPGPEDVAKFVAAAQQDFQSTYDALVDRLLESQHFGERWARHWLDIARFAESNGYAFDKDRPNAFRYRDFVIRAFNADMPYDRFVRLQLAGDLVADVNVKTTAESLQATHLIAATGFLVAGPFTTQQTEKERERSRYQQLDDMVHTLGTSLLGLTLGCSRCHSHKYDPLPMHDYYRLASCFADVGFSNTAVNAKPEAHREAQAKFNTVYGPLVAARGAFEKEHLGTRFEAWFESHSQRPAPPEIQPWQHVGPFTVQGFDEAFDTAFPPEAAFPEAGVDLTASYRGGNLKWKEQKDWKDGAVHRTLTGTKAANYLFRVIETEVAQEVDVSLGSGDAIKLWLNGKPIVAKKVKRAATAEQEHVQLQLQAGRNELLLKIVNLDGPSGFYFKSMSERPPEDVAKLLAAPQAEWKEPERKKVHDWFKQFDPVWRDLQNAVAIHAQQSPKPELTQIYAARKEGETYRFGDDTYKVYHVLRGNPDNKEGEARPGFLQVLMPAEQRESVWFASARAPDSPAQGASAQGASAKPARIALADWLTDVDSGAGHLLARVIVNRLWHHHFGRGIVSTCSDFGTRGEKPTHPQLLDWLALELVRGGWRLKPIHRLIVTSSTYMQAGGITDHAANVDPANLLWWRRPPRRLEAEIIRDALLAVGGTLDRSMYGTGTLDPKTPRRSIYLTVKRSQLIRMLQLFDTPGTMQGIGVRQESTVAPQALAMLNSPMLRQVATRFASRARPDPAASLPESIDRAFRIALTRPPESYELAAMETFIHRQAESRGDGVLPPRSPQGDEEKASELAFLDFCHLVLCMNEFVYVD